jgi:hypothetical protein
MATFEAQVEALTSLSIGSSGTSPTQSELTQFLTDGAKEIINFLPPRLLELCASSVSFTSGSASTLNTGKILRVFRSDGDIKQPCRKISANIKGRVSDLDDMSYATITDPVYYIENNSLDVLPGGGSCTYSEVKYHTVNYSDSSIGSISLTGVRATPADPTVFTKTSHGLNTGDVVELSNFSEMTEINGMIGTVLALDANTFSINGLSADPEETTGGNVLKGVFPDEAEYLVTLYGAIRSLQSAMGNKRSELPSDVPYLPTPTVPTISTISYTNATNEDASVDVIAVPAQIDVSSNAPSFIKPVVSPDFSQVDTHLDTNEDAELASVKIQEIQSQIAEYNANIQNEQAEFNKENARYQMEFQEATSKNNQDLQAEVEKFRIKADVAKSNKQKDQILNLTNAAKQIEDVIADNNSKIQKYSSEVQSYQAKVSSEIQNYSAKIQKHSIDYQWLIGQYQQLKADYNQGLQLLAGGGVPQQQARS